MEILKYLSLGVIGIGVFIILVFALRTKQATKMLLINSVIGFGIFLVLYFTRKYTGINLNLNVYTAIGSAVFGIPAIIVFLLLNFLM